jgi:hypothetical protein
MVSCKKLLFFKVYDFVASKCGKSCKQLSGSTKAGKGKGVLVFDHSDPLQLPRFKISITAQTLIEQAYQLLEEARSHQESGK